MATRVAEVKVVGEVRAVELRDDGGGVFRLRLEDGTVVSGEFAADYAAVVTQAFQLHRWNHLGVKGDGEFDGNGALRHIRGSSQLRITKPGGDPDALASQDPEDDVLARMVEEGQEPGSVNGVNLAEVFAEIREKYPVGEDDVEPPADFAANYKHYLYGFPKEGGAGAASDPPPDIEAEQHILEVFEELRNSPDGQEVAEVWPTDLASNLAHYLYGHPKREI